MRCRYTRVRRADLDAWPNSKRATAVDDNGEWRKVAVAAAAAGGGVCVCVLVWRIAASEKVESQKSKERKLFA